MGSFANEYNIMYRCIYIKGSLPDGQCFEMKQEVDEDFLPSSSAEKLSAILQHRFCSEASHCLKIPLSV